MAGALLGKYALMRNQQIAKSALKRDICGPSLAAKTTMKLILFSSSQRARTTGFD